MDIKDDKGKVIAKVTAADVNSGDVGEGVWVEVQADDGTKPTICLVKQKGKSSRNPAETNPGWYMGFYRDAKSPGAGCDFAISLTADGPVIQAVKGDAVKSANLFDLLAHFESHCKRDV